MKYEEVIQLWGATKVANYNRLTVEKIELTSVVVDFDFNEGYSCCGGRDPDCYCSFYETPSASVVVWACSKDGRSYSWKMDIESFSFTTVLQEICEAGEGEITA